MAYKSLQVTESICPAEIPKRNPIDNVDSTCKKCHTRGQIHITKQLLN